MYLLIASHITSVYIRINARVDHRMVKCGIEYSLFILCSTGYLHTTQFFVPRIVCLLFYLIKVFRSNLLLKVLRSTFHINKGDTDFHLHFFSFLGRKLGEESKVFALQFFLICNHRSF